MIQVFTSIELAIIISLNMLIVLTILGLLYIVLKPRSRRVTEIYLSGEGEDVIASKAYTPSPIHLYWGFIKRFARTVYGYLTEAMHTGNLMDWVEYMISWYGLLILISIIILVVYIIIGSAR